MRRFFFFPALALTAIACTAPAPEPYGPVPTDAQVAWQRMEINMFCHFGPNTFSGAEWGDGNETEDLFHPSALDCHQWVDVAAQAGMGGIIITAKHHDGFCLWPSQYSTHTVAQSSWNEGHGDVLRQLRTAIDDHNSSSKTKNVQLQMGVYISPWDRNHPAYGTEEYNDVFANTLREVHITYGPLFEQWFDGACGEGPNGKQQVYDWPLFESTVHTINPLCVIFSDVGPGCRWVGNEEGHAGETNWSSLRVENGERRTEKGGCGDEPISSLITHHSSLKWIPAEVDVSIRPGWFWHVDEQPKTVDQLMEIYFNSVGRNGLLLLNVPPDPRGRIALEDSAVLVAFRAERDRLFANDLAQEARIHAKHLRGRRYRAHNMIDTAYHSYWASTGEGPDTIFIDFRRPTDLDVVMLQEYIPLGQRVSRFHLEYYDPSAGWTPLATGTTIGYKRLLRTPLVTTEHLRLVLDSALAAPVLNRIALYNSKD